MIRFTYAALHNRQLQGYVRAFASFHGVNNNDDNPAVSYNTRVELAEKKYGGDGQEDGWTLTTKTLVELNRQTLQAVWNKEVSLTYELSCTLLIIIYDSILTRL